MHGSQPGVVGGARGARRATARARARREQWKGRRRGVTSAGDARAIDQRDRRSTRASTTDGGGSAPPRFAITRLRSPTVRQPSRASALSKFERHTTWVRIRPRAEQKTFKRSKDIQTVQHRRARGCDDALTRLPTVFQLKAQPMAEQQHAARSAIELGLLEHLREGLKRKPTGRRLVDTAAP